jgi:hypothetical protein
MKLQKQTEAKVWRAFWWLVFVLFLLMPLFFWMATHQQTMIDWEKAHLINAQGDFDTTEFVGWTIGVGCSGLAVALTIWIGLDVIKHWRQDHENNS